MSSKFTQEAVMKFLAPQFPWIDVNVLKQFYPFKDFNLTKYREFLIKYSLLITHAGTPIWILQ